MTLTGVGGAVSSNIVSVDVGSGATAALSTLPVSLDFTGAAYAPGNDTVYAFGGTPLYATPAAYSTLSDKVYLFGGANGAVLLNAIVAVSLNAGVQALPLTRSSFLFYTGR